MSATDDRETIAKLQAQLTERQANDAKMQTHLACCVECSAIVGCVLGLSKQEWTARAF